MSMTSREWQKSTNAIAMLGELYPLRGMDSTEPQTRQSRLYLFACANEVRDRLPGVCRTVLELAEQVFGEPRTNKALRDQIYPYAESLVHCRGELEDVNEIGHGLVALGHAEPGDVLVKEHFDPQVWCGFAHLAYAPFDRTTPNFRRIPMELHSAEMLREIFGNPLERLPPFQPMWRTSDVIRLAQHANETPDFSVLPILADALQDAGCNRNDILNHLRHDEQHRRGCWVLETILNNP